MKITIRTQDGECPAHVFRPAKTPAPGVLMYMDGIGMRPALEELGERLASMGYYVLLPDMFYRAGAYTAPDPKALFTDPEVLKAWRGVMATAGGQANCLRDTPAFLDHLANAPDVAPGKYGVTGYCMGGGLAIVAAGHFPDRFAAAAAFHPGGLATDAPDSPHRLAPRITARIYVAGASEDANFPDEQKARFVEALTAAGVTHTVETYPARHGWVPRDTPVHDAACAERHWAALRDLFGATLGQR